MQLEQQETFTIHGPQLEVLGEVESKLPAPAKKRSTASVVLVALALVSVFGIGGAKLKEKYNALVPEHNAFLRRKAAASQYSRQVRNYLESKYQQERNRRYQEKKRSQQKKKDYLE